MADRLPVPAEVRPAPAGSSLEFGPVPKLSDALPSLKLVGLDRAAQMRLPVHARTRAVLPCGGFRPSAAAHLLPLCLCFTAHGDSQLLFRVFLMRAIRL
jgi:hypothetical protein